MRNFIVIAILGALLAGCASTVPTCDGTDRRPVNAPAHAGATYHSCGNAA